MTAPVETERNHNATGKGELRRVIDSGEYRKYRTEIPNIVLTLGLTPYALALYVHLKRTAGGDGLCWKSTATLARETGMSSGMVSKAKESLQKHIDSLGGKSLITVTEERNPKGGKPNHTIAITDIWPENMARFASSQGEVATVSSSPLEVGTSYRELASSPHELASSPGEIRKEPIQEQTQDQGTIQEKDHQRVARADVRGSRLPDDFCLSSEMKEWAAKEVPTVDVEKALSEFKDYWRGVPGQRGRKLDWPATFRNRLRDIANRGSRFQHNGSNQRNTSMQTGPIGDYEFRPKAVIR
jgi:hypothetical protein